MNPTVLEIQNVSHSFGKEPKKNRVLHDLDLKINEGDIVSLVGPSGCGKSVLLRAILGTHPPEYGKIIVYSGDKNEDSTVRLKPDRDIGIVYQRYSLFPFLTAIENVAFGLMVDQTKLPFRLFRPFKWKELRETHLQQAETLLHKVKLGHALHRYPSQLSGGMCQRVAIAQALIMKPRILLLDEPFGALDEATRSELQDMLLELYAENQQAKQSGQKPPYTILLVTHELSEAIRVGNRVLGISMNWDWQKAHKVFPGATFVYDKTAPVFEPAQPIDHQAMQAQKDEIAKSVFDPQHLQDRNQFRESFGD